MNEMSFISNLHSRISNSHGLIEYKNLSMDGRVFCNLMNGF